MPNGHRTDGYILVSQDLEKIEFFKDPKTLHIYLHFALICDEHQQVTDSFYRIAGDTGLLYAEVLSAVSKLIDYRYLQKTKRGYRLINYERWLRFEDE